MNTEQELNQDPIKKLTQIMEKLRAPNGCPWDRKQTYQSLCPYITEEAYELIDAIQKYHEEDSSIKNVIEESGDLLLQVVFIATIAKEQGDFTLDDVANAICEKLIRRHPHVFADVKADDANAVLKNWEAIKQAEKSSKKEDTSILSGVPRSLPSTTKAFRIQQKAAAVGFDWEKGDQTPVVEKIKEELEEIRQAMAKGTKEDVTGEIGDLMFSVINLARRLEIDPELALARTNSKFQKRFKTIEEHIQNSGKKWDDFDLDSLDKLWDIAKKDEAMI